MPQPHIQVILAEDAVPETLRVALTHIPASTSFWSLAEAVQHDATRSADILVLAIPDDISSLRRPLQLLFDRLAEHPRPVLVLAAARGAVPLLHAPVVPVTFGDPHDERDLLTRLTVLLELRPALDALLRGLLVNRRNGQNATRRYLGQLRLASRVQRQFLPEVLPALGPVRCEVLFRPADYVSGDIYDVHRLDEDHVGIALADASGHGIPAALLTVYIKRALRGKEVEHGHYRILAPDEVLARLNDDLLDAELTECPFVAALYAVLNTRTLELSVARGGAPFPLLRSADGAVHVLDLPGGVVGVSPGAQFTSRQIQLERGDSLLIYSDGLERLISTQPAHERIRRADTSPVANPASLPHFTAEPPAGGLAIQTASVALASPPVLPDLPSDNPWFQTLRDAGVDVALRQLDRRHHTLRRMACALDDLTVIVLRVGA